jgi:hypothetical protein
MKDYVINSYIVIAGIAAGILILWFGLGFILPVVMFKNGWEGGGTFGDSFGSVNALFSGLGFFALSYTIYLQIKNSQEQKHQEHFGLYLKLIDEIKQDLNNVEYNGLKGMNGLYALKEVLAPDIYVGRKERLKSYFIYLLNVNHQINVVLDLVEKDKNINKDQENLIKAKLVQAYLAYLQQLYTYLLTRDYKEKFFKFLKGSCALLEKRIRKYTKKLKIG